MSLDITLEALTKDFGRVRALDDVNFEIGPGRLVGLLGPNGSGKTTALRTLLGLVAPTTGRALIGGRRFSDLDAPARQVGAVLEAGARRMHALISAELLRLRTVRSPRYSALGLLAFVALVTALNVGPGAAPTSPDELADSLRSLAVIGGVVFAGALAATNVGTEFQRGSAVLTYLSHPDRGRVTAARALIYPGLGFVLAGLAAGVVFAVGVPVANAGGVSAADVARVVAGTAAGGAVTGAAGALLDTATRNPTIASAAFFGWNLVEMVVFPAGVRPYLPFSLVNSLIGAAGDVPVPAAMGLLLAYLAAVAPFVHSWSLKRDLT
jgi:energy-coupling factor transporter ATP-binding protein EcfA2